MNFINAKTYTELLNHYLSAVVLQNEVRRHTDAIMTILGKDKEVAGDSIVDVVYSPTTLLSEDVFRELLLKNNVQVDWTSVTEESNKPDFQTEVKQRAKKTKPNPPMVE